ncbi:CrcB family protein [Xylanimonas oleitrophica]|uniref:Fluoride-specific ion channel FluC n=1 Tax=Xylanimonas oleitrophica TaxID=2607479 RepID=A0A2W5YFJ7_9MICO|nr:CrcB family protein [Xylanimonas oleitrophica]PZR53321.1 CrcB family protein [Xylanimonas oleitrophica]
MTSAHPAPHRDVRLLGLVALGGALGSVLRYAVSLVTPAPGGWPLATLSVNVLGAFLLGFLLEALARRGPETRRLQRLRLTLGTGVLGGFTTYSSFALEIERLPQDGAAAVAVGYAAATLVVGTLAAVVGVALGARVPASTSSRLVRLAEERAEGEQG